MPQSNPAIQLTIKQLAIVLSLILLTACVANKANTSHEQIAVDTPGQKPALTLIDLKSKFKYHDLKTFDHNFTWEKLDTMFKHVDSTEFKLIFQEGDRKFIDNEYERDYYYSWQNRDKKFTEFTMLSVDESNSCLLLKYYIFDKKDKFVSKFDIASACGDGGWVFKARGHQLNLSAFKYDMVDYEGDLSDDTEEGDSTSLQITINSKGKISEKELSKKHFKRKNQ